MVQDINAWIAVTIFVIAYALIVSERVHRAVVALAGAAAIVFAGVISQDRAVAAIDFNTIGLLVGMMIIVAVTRRSGVFEFLAVLAAQVARGEPRRILAALAAVTAVLSAFLDNVTAVFLVVPVTFAITRTLQLRPFPFLVAEIIASNIGGTATLIGDPPNIMISGPAGLGFVDFLVNLAPVAAVVFLVTIPLLILIYRRRMVADPELQAAVMRMEPGQYLHDRPLLYKSLTVLGLTIVGFTLHQFVHLPTATIALGGAALLLLITGGKPDELLREVEWGTIFFFAGLFVLVGALEETGVIRLVARLTLELTGGDLILTGLLVLWVAALASTVVDNIPFVAAMIPLLHEVGRLGGIADLEPLWWSLALGACLGGNGSLVGAAANVVVAGLAEKHGYPMRFLRYLAAGFPLMVLSVAISTAYLLLFHLR
ncbi:MAG: ArsB/NhaD family transporter [Bacillota bacterium]